jgi:hypothetical protein
VRKPLQKLSVEVGRIHSLRWLNHPKYCRVSRVMSRSRIRFRGRLCDDQLMNATISGGGSNAGEGLDTHQTAFEAIFVIFNLAE